jgi:3-hydroxyisobutyrate dehydrogenase-like beta-hydroxyacid dehydrogenase
MTRQMRMFLGNRASGAESPSVAGICRAFESFAGIAAKDLDCALNAALDCGVELPATQTARSLIRRTYLTQ